MFCPKNRPPAWPPSNSNTPDQRKNGNQFVALCVYIVFTNFNNGIHDTGSVKGWWYLTLSPDRPALAMQSYVHGEWTTAIQSSQQPRPRALHDQVHLPCSRACPHRSRLLPWSMLSPLEHTRSRKGWVREKMGGCIIVCVCFRLFFFKLRHSNRLMDGSDLCRGQGEMY